MLVGVLLLGNLVAIHGFSTVTATTHVPTVTVFHHGMGGFYCIRIPSITKCGPHGTLHAFAECRPWIGDGCQVQPGAEYQEPNCK